MQTCVLINIKKYSVIWHSYSPVLPNYSKGGRSSVSYFWDYLCLALVWQVNIDKYNNCICDILMLPKEKTCCTH